MVDDQGAKEGFKNSVKQDCRLPTALSYHLLVVAYRLPPACCSLVVHGTLKLSNSEDFPLDAQPTPTRNVGYVKDNRRLCSKF